MTPYSLFASGRHTRGWIKDFYDQAGEWWGPDPQEPGVHEARRADRRAPLRSGPPAGPRTRRRLRATAPPPWPMPGTRWSPSSSSPTRAALARGLAEAPRRGQPGSGRGRLLHRGPPGPSTPSSAGRPSASGPTPTSAACCAASPPSGSPRGAGPCVDVYNPARPARDAGTEERLPPLPGVPGSVEMFERCHFDARHCRWIDEWVPVAAPEKALAQSIRCYSPADLALLLEGTGLAMRPPGTGRRGAARRRRRRHHPLPGPARRRGATWPVLAAPPTAAEAGGGPLPSRPTRGGGSR